MDIIKLFLLSILIATDAHSEGLSEYRAHSRILNAEKRIWIYEPVAARGQTDLATVYMIDGQNAFEERLSSFGKTWDADAVAERLIANHQTRPFIIIGIESTGTRLDELTPPADAATAGGGKGDQFLRFLRDELIPWVEDRYNVVRAPDSRVLVGSSLGGLFTTYAAFEAQGTPAFGRFAALSPSLWWANQGLVSRLARQNRSIGPRSFYSDVGLKEGRKMVRGARTVDILVSKMNCASHPCSLSIEDPEGKHDELAWGSRLPEALKFLIGE